MLFANSLGGLESVERVREVNIRIGFIDKLVQGIDVFHHGHAEVIAIRPILVLKVRAVFSVCLSQSIIFLF